MANANSKNGTTILTLPTEIRALIFRGLCDDRPTGPHRWRDLSQQRSTIARVLQTCGTFRHEAMPVFLSYATFGATNQRVVDYLAAMIGKHSLSQIRNVFLHHLRSEEYRYDLLGSFPNLKRLDINLGVIYCDLGSSLEEDLRIRKAAILTHCNYALYPLLTGDMLYLLPYRGGWPSCLIVDCASSESPSTPDLYLHFELATVCEEAVGLTLDFPLKQRSTLTYSSIARLMLRIGNSRSICQMDWTFANYMSLRRRSGGQKDRPGWIA
jgi:hypothetical protein